MIKVEMDMPVSCSMCPFELFYHKMNYAFCPYTDEDVSQMVDRRSERCPLKEGENDVG